MPSKSKRESEKIKNNRKRSKKVFAFARCERNLSLCALVFMGFYKPCSHLLNLFMGGSFVLLMLCGKPCSHSMAFASNFKNGFYGNK